MANIVCIPTRPLPPYSLLEVPQCKQCVTVANRVAAAAERQHPKHLKLEMARCSMKILADLPKIPCTHMHAYRLLTQHNTNG